MRRSLIIALAITTVVVAGCATVEAAPGSTSDALRYSCAGGKRFTAAWNQPGDRVKVSAGGVTKSLPGARSGSGARYAAGDFEIWGKGETATLSGFPGGPYNNCRAG
jgi:membrane-bound inhibitor of C-type lysozyme